ncbi:unnamed protein product [Strongylus vulgaris]|uniref:Uncharacterized protein n=1 Tax=Strongylus vulgaris TaxID=40348 RepID=A0A3P7JUW1_STRVU|nr:unnamed protein product [Strongylus vulgaris]
MLLVLWCLPEPEASIAITIIFVVAIMTDKPLFLIWVTSKMYVKCCKGDTIAQVDDSPKNISEMSTATTTANSETLKQRCALDKGKGAGMGSLQEVFVNTEKKH